MGPIIIGTKDLAACKQFYKSVFGVVIEEEKDHYIRCRGVDGSVLEIETDSEDRFPNWAEHNVGTYKNSEFQVLDIASFLSLVEQPGGAVVSPSKKKSWGG